MQKFLEKTWKISQILKNFSNENKLAILCFLWEKEKNVSELLKCCNISQSQVSQYLWKMKLEWILDSRKDWKEVYYKIADKQTLKLIEKLKEVF